MMIIILFLNNLQYILFLLVFLSSPEESRIINSLSMFVIVDFSIYLFKFITKKLSLLNWFRRIFIWIFFMFGSYQNSFLLMKVGFIVFYLVPIMFVLIYKLKRNSFVISYAKEYVLGDINNLKQTEIEFIDKRYLINNLILISFSTFYLLLSTNAYIIVLFTFNILLHIFLVLSYTRDYVERFPVKNKNEINL